MGDPLRKPSDPFPSSDTELGDIVPRDLGGSAGSSNLQQERQDPSLFDDRPNGPAIDDLAVAPSPVQPQRNLPEAPPQGQSQVKNKQRRNRRGGFSFTLLIFGAIGFVAFGAGASLAYFILSGTLDVDQGWIKDNLSVIKNLVKEWRQ